MSLRGVVVACAAVVSLLAVHTAAPAQEADRTRAAIVGPPPPVAPAVISRDGGGGATVRAVRLTAPVDLDGRLDEAWYRDTPPLNGFIQSLPDEGAPASEETEAWIGFDDDAVYVSARVWDSAPESEWVANELRRDTNQLRQNDTFTVMFDTYLDRRNGVAFYTNPLGAMAEFQITNEGNPNMDWNPVWEVRTGRFDGGWTVEMEIPFKSLRYRPGTEQLWGVQMRRAIRRKNEWAHLTFVPASAAGTGSSGSFRVSAYGTLVGVEAPPPSRRLEVKPYGISGLRSERVAATRELSDDLYADAGLDVKYGVTENLTLDLTYNTDFAQVEVDEQQVNLTRFNLQFPEKREFFLEGRGIFDFAPGGGLGGGGGGNAPQLFFSRRIGLEGGEPIPILGGGRLTGKAGAFDVGALAVRTGEQDEVTAPSTSFTVLRLRRDVLRRSSVGMLFAGRSESTLAEGSNQTYGVDGSFSFYDNVNFLAWYGRTETPGLGGRDDAFQGRFSYDHDTYGVTLDHMRVGNDFNPEVGFVRRDDFRQSFVSGRYSPRPRSLESVRKVTFQTHLNYLTNDRGGFVEERERQGQFQVEFETGDVFSAVATDVYEHLAVPFRIAPEIVVPAGSYAYRGAQLSYNLGLQRRVSGTLAFQHGSFYGGDRTSLGFQRGRVEILPQFSLEPSISFNWVELPQGSFTSHLAATRLNYSFSPRMFLSGLVQYNTSTATFASNVRLRWEYAPGSEIFVVYTDDRDVDVLDRFSELTNRGLVIKVNRLLRP